MKTIRNSSIELFKIIGMILIILSHSMPVMRQNQTYIDTGVYMNLALSTVSWQRLVVLFFRYCGQIGNAIFIISSAWFLIDSRKAKLEKVIQLFLDSFLISIFFLISYIVLGVNIGANEAIKQILPISFQNNWYIGCYILLYLMHPILNVIINELSKKDLLVTVMVLFALYSVWYFAFKSNTYYTRLVGFVYVYLMTGYLKKYKLFSDLKAVSYLTGIIVGFAGVVLMIVLVNALGLHISFFSYQLERFNEFTNPFMLLIGFSGLFFALNKQFVSQKINYISSTTLLIYLIHGNYLFQYHTIGDFYNFVLHRFTYRYELGWVLAVALFLMITTTVLSCIYKETIQKATNKIAPHIASILSVLCNHVIDRIG